MVKFQAHLAGLVKTTGQLAIDHFVQELTQFTLQKFPRDASKAQSNVIDASLVRYICNLIEAVVKRKSKTDAKVDKLQIAIRIYESLNGTPMNEQQKQQFVQLVEDMHVSGALKGLTLWRQVRKEFSAFFKKMLG